MLYITTTINRYKSKTLSSTREDAAFVEKTSSASVREKTKTPLQRMLIGAVPDRGGRPREQRPPAPEMPGWQKRKPDVIILCQIIVWPIANFR